MTSLPPVNGSNAVSDTRAEDSSLCLPPEIDFTRPSPARMYDYYLDGKDNFAVDRKAAEEALSVVPDGRRIARDNRKFLVRAVKYLARNGIDQFIDLGTGIPTSPNVHETAKAINPRARVAYVDNDPMVTVHNRALLGSAGDGIATVRGDIRYPVNVISNHALNEVIDFERPIGFLFVAVLHFIPEDENPYQAVAAFRDRAPAGSYIAISHITSDGTDPHVIKAIQDAYQQASAPAVFRDRAQIGRLFDGFELVRPGLADVCEWRISRHPLAGPPTVRFLCGVGRKP